MPNNILNEVQDEVTRIRNMIAETNICVPNSNINWCIYILTLKDADRAIREHDTISLIKLLPKLEEM